MLEELNLMSDDEMEWDIKEEKSKPLYSSDWVVYAAIGFIAATC